MDPALRERCLMITGIAAILIIVATSPVWVLTLCLVLLEWAV